jgi:hypothetical protein
MAENKVRLANGQLWTAQQFLDHYLKPSASGIPGPPAPVPVDMSWYMGEGPGRYYHPGMFPIINRLVDRHDLAPGAYDLLDFVPKKDPSLTAGISHYATDMSSADYHTRALVFGNESARISGQVVVNQDGSKTFRQIEIRPWDTDFNFKPKGGGIILEGARAIARQIYDPENRGVSYQIPIRGVGRIYEPFTDAQLSTALRNEADNPGSGPSGLLPSTTDGPPPYIKQYLQYLNQMNDGTSQASVSGTGASAVRFVSPSNGVANWMASMAGVDSQKPTQPAPSQADGLRGIVSDNPMPKWPFPPVGGPG